MILLPPGELKAYKKVIDFLLKIDDMTDPTIGHQSNRGPVERGYFSLRKLRQYTEPAIPLPYLAINSPRELMAAASHNFGYDREGGC